MVSKHQNKILTAILVSEASHIFCCALPTLFSILSLMGSFGLIVVMPGWMQSLHGALHAYELPLIIFSALVIGLGWALHYLAHHQHKIGAHDHECCDHDHGAPTKAKTTHIILLIATILLVINVFVYFTFHRHQGASEISEHSSHSREEDGRSHEH